MAEGNVDGKITFGITFDNKQAEKAVKELEQRITEIFKKLGNPPSLGLEKVLNDAINAAGELQKALNEGRKAQEGMGGGPSAKPRGNPFDPDTYAGRLWEAERAMRALKSAGKGLGDKDFDEAYRKLALLRAEAKQYAAELSKTPAEAEREAAAAEAAMVDPLERQEAALRKEMESLNQAAQKAREHTAALHQQNEAFQAIRDNAQVADEKIVAMNMELRTLQERLAMLKAAGVGPGYQEYDRISRRIQEINQGIRAYQSGVKGAKKQTSAMASATDRAHASLDRMTKRLAGTLKSALIFSVIYKGLSVLKTYLGKVMKSNAAFTAQLAQLKGALLTAFQPVMQVIIPALISFMQILTRVVSTIAGLTARLAGKSKAQMAKDAKAMYDEAKAIDKVGGSAKAAGKQLASFDEINQLSGDSGSAGGGSSASSEEIAPNFDTQAYTDKLDELTAYIGGALLAIGVILAFSGVNIPLGLALIAAGAAVLASEAQENWGAMSEETKGRIAEVYAVASAALLVLGVILAFSGWKIPLGIALIALGAMGLVTAAQLNSNAIVEMLQGPIGTIVAIVSGALLAIGIILVCTGVMTALGIALIAAGAAGLVTVAALNWNAIVSALQGPIGGIVAIVSAVLLVIGIILVCTGVGLPLGIALIAAGAAGLVTVTALNWNAISDKVKGVWNTIKTWWKTSVAKYFTLQFWKDTFSNIASGLTSKIKDGINAAISLLNRFIGWLNDKMHLEWGSFSLFGKEVIPSGSFQLLTLPNIPYLAQGAVIPPNREFMAVLGDQKQGTNIEAPLETIKQALAEVMAQYGGRENGDMTVILELDNREFGRAVVKSYKEESRRVGVSLAY